MIQRDENVIRLARRFHADESKMVWTEADIGPADSPLRRSGVFVPAPSRDGLVRFMLDADELCQQLATSVGAGPVEEIVPGELWRLGRSGVPICRARRELLFLRSSAIAGVREALRTEKTGTLIIVGSERGCVLRPADAARCLALASVARLSPNARWELVPRAFGTVRKRDPALHPQAAVHAAWVSKLAVVLRNARDRLLRANRNRGTLDFDAEIKSVTYANLALECGMPADRVRNLIKRRNRAGECVHPELARLWLWCHDEDSIRTTSYPCSKHEKEVEERLRREAEEAFREQPTLQSEGRTR